MPAKKKLTDGQGPSANGVPADPTLVDVARSIGTSLGTAAAKAEDAAKEIETFSKTVRKRTVAATRKLYKRAQKSLRAGAASWKSKKKKRNTPKKAARKSTGRAK